ncbi:hypothetical protein T08_2664 [Trichinella sp. T8]|nr:hypothetical protein T08_2664 [Trichinella sp. T8]
MKCIFVIQYKCYYDHEHCLEDIRLPRQTNAYVSNKWPLKLPCAYLNTQGSGPFENRLKRIGGG